jgi:hypothetical protein
MILDGEVLEEEKSQVAEEKETPKSLQFQSPNLDKLETD